MGFEAIGFAIPVPTFHGLPWTTAAGASTTRSPTGWVDLTKGSGPMTQRFKAVLPLSLAVALLTFAWLEVSLNFTFHWFTDGDLGVGLELPRNFHLVAPAGFVSWAVYFAAGADRPAATKAALASVVGAVAGLMLMWLAPGVADLPDFFGIAVVAGFLAFGVVALAAVGDSYFTPGVFGGFAAIVFWWIATGLDGWAPDGGGVGNSVAALGKPETAGSGAFGGVLSTPVEMVFASILASLLCGVVLGVLSVRLAGVLNTVMLSRSAERQDVTAR